VPVVLADGTVLGLLRADGDLEALQSADDLAALQHSGRLLATLLDAEQRAERLHRRAERAEAESLTDDLTGLPNGRAWWRALLREASRCDRYDLAAVVAVVDLDGLKTINDTQGHLAGDLLLRTLGETLTNSVRESDVVARLGGDEFGVLAVDYQPPLPDTMVDRLRAGLDVAGISASVGADVYRTGDIIDDTFHRADADMYVVKRERSQRAS
jgi:diguanylate cyclase (GGDEF)-like protein